MNSMFLEYAFDFFRESLDVWYNCHGSPFLLAWLFTTAVRFRVGVGPSVYDAFDYLSRVTTALECSVHMFVFHLSVHRIAA